MSLIGATRELSVSYVLRTVGGSRVAGFAAALAAVVAVSPPPTAQAASVFANTFRDAVVEGEVNSVTVVRIGDSYQITDTTATLFASDPCTVDASGHVATCPVPAADPTTPPFGFSLGGQDDTISNQAADGRVTISGEAGDDTLTGGAAADFIDGSVGYDDVHGGDGDDMLFDGPDEDRVDGGAGRDNLQAGDGADDLLGGPGEDTADYGVRLDPVTVILDDQPNDGEEDEFDYVAGDVENVRGGDADDRLIGNDAANYLLAGNERERRNRGGRRGGRAQRGRRKRRARRGRRTRQHLRPGRRRPDRGPGREKDSIRCGVGTDSVVADYNDSVNVDCELVDRSPAPPPPPPPKPDLMASPSFAVSRSARRAFPPPAEEAASLPWPARRCPIG